jgi:LmbE family N-acetylglucosaminyl deacetylase
LSPHLDDAVLSCGGLIHQQAQQGRRPLVVTCFSGMPDYGFLSPFAAELHRRWGQPSDPVALRREEDMEAMACLGAEHLHLNFVDCIYRRDDNGAFPYASEAALFGAVHASDQPLERELAERLRTVCSAGNGACYVPLAVGHHVDHQLVLRAASRLRSSAYRLWYYEDYPYAEQQGALDLTLAGWTARPTPRLVYLEELDLRAKISAILSYRSQTQVLFGDENSVGDRVSAFARRIGQGGRYAEKYWCYGLA